MPYQIPLIPDVPQGVQEAAQLGNLIPFIGAGASRLAGCPSWIGFADAALQFLIRAGTLSYSQFDQIKDLNPRVKLSLARAIARDKGLAIDYRALLHPKPKHEHKDGCDLYGNLFRLGNKFVTTNYDEWLDDDRIPRPALATAAVPENVNMPQLNRMRVVHQVEEFLPSLLSRPNTVIHLHGSVNEPEKMILTTQDYLRHYANDRRSAAKGDENQVLTFLEELFRSKTVLFMGYGLEEIEILEYVISKANAQADSEKSEKHYMLRGFLSHEQSLSQSLASYYMNEFGIRMVSFNRDERDWNQLANVVEKWAGNIPASEPLISIKKQEMERWLDE